MAIKVPAGLAGLFSAALIKDVTKVSFYPKKPFMAFNLLLSDIDFNCRHDN